MIQYGKIIVREAAFSVVLDLAVYASLAAVKLRKLADKLKG